MGTMAAPSDRKQPRTPGTVSPESSLTWCLAHLSKPGSEHQGQSKADTGTRETDKRSRICQWRALLAIRTQHIKDDRAGIARFRSQGGLGPLVELLRQPGCSRKTLDLALSILANCCTEMQTCVEVRKLDGINVVVDILKRNVALVTVQNRAARALGNLAMDPESSALIHSAGGVPLLLLCVSLSSAPSSPTAAPPKDSCPKQECAQSAARALLYLSDTPSNRLSLLTQGAFSALAPLLAPEYPQGLRRAVLRTLHELTKGCGVECSREVSRSGALAQLGVMASGEAGKPFEELALKTLANMCTQGCLRPLVGSLGVIPKFTEEVKKDPLKSGVFLKALCLCCKEAVNRAKVKESGGLEVLTGFLGAHQNHPLARLAILACVDFVFDESAMEQLQELGLVHLLIARLVQLTRGEEQPAEKMDMSVTSSVSPTDLLPSACFDSFDFPSPDAYKKEEGGKEHGLCSSSFLSLRSWLVSEGLISSEGDLLHSSGSVDGDWGGLQVPSSLSSPNPESHSSGKTSAPLNPPVPSTPHKPPQPSPLSSSSQTQTQSQQKNTDPPPTSPQPSAASSPQTQSTPCALSSQSKTPVSPSKFCSPHRRRQRGHVAMSLSKVTLETPPSAPRPVAYHPYHPEPWTPESPILLLLSRFSHASDPSTALVNAAVMSALIYYLTRHQDPSSRCFRMLCRLSCNPNCLQALVRSGSVALIQYHLCQREDGGSERVERQTGRVKAKVKQLGFALLNNLRVQCESGFGSGVLSHVMLSGTESDKMNCALSLPLISSNKALLKKLLLDSGGLLLALQPLSAAAAEDDDDDMDEERSTDCEQLLPDSPHSGLTSHLHPLYFCLMVGCLSALNGIRSFDRKQSSPIQSRLLRPGAAPSPPPLKKPRLADLCPYAVSNFDLFLLLDDGTQVPANREAVGGAEGADGAGSDYFRALLRGGFGEAQGTAETAIPIKDVSEGMLLPVLHYLHGCRLGEQTREQDEEEGRRRCPVLDSLVLDGLGFCPKRADEPTFQKTPLGEMMIGACRFLVTALQKELEDLCVRLLSRFAKATEDDTGKAVHKTDNVCSESAEENLVNRTSELELSGFELQTDQKPNSAIQPKTLQKTKTIKGTASGSKSSCADKPLGPEETELKPKNSVKGPSKPDAQDWVWWSESSRGGGAVAALLPQVYWFSQRYSYPALGRTCLSLLLGGQDPHGPSLSPSLAGVCLRRFARVADCTETLKQDLVSLASAALS